MKTVWKTRIDLEGKWVDIPKGSIPIYVAVQNDYSLKLYEKEICVWWLVNTSSTEMVSKKIFVYGTGHDIPHDKEYIGSFMLLNGKLVFHVFHEDYD